MSKELESKVQKRCMETIRKRGGYVYKNAQSMYTEVGRPDLAACIPVKLKTLCNIFGEDADVGLFVGFEIKRQGHLNNVSSAQEIVGRQISNAAGLWYAVDSADAINVLLDGLEVTK